MTDSANRPTDATPASARRDRSAAALAELRQRWRAGDRVPVEAILASQSGPLDDDALLDLIYQEVVLRQEAGEQPRLAEFQQRFPRFGKPLALLFEVDDAIAANPGSQPPAGARGSDMLSGGGQAATAWRPPPVLAGYEILEMVGRGGMGVVYKARDGQLGRLAALKFLRPDRARDPEALERFRREARTTSALNHPNICTIYELAEIDGQPFIAMEFVEGLTLRALAKSLTLDALMPLLAQVVRALEVAHAAGVVHRDLKPENIMVRADQYVKLLDFGLVRLLSAGVAGMLSRPDRGTDPGTLIGTVHYMAPEQARAEDVGAAADVFALGTILYELAAGRHPFAGEAPMAVLQAIMTAEPLPPRRLNPIISPALESLILSMLAKAPLLRPTAAAVARALAAPTGAAGPSAPLPPDRGSVGRQAERSALHDALARARAGRGGFLCVSGEPGLGKSTLVEDFVAALAAAPDCAVAVGRCSERLAGTAAYLPILEALDYLLQGPGGATAARLVKTLAPTWYVALTPLAAGDPAFAHALAEAAASSTDRMMRELAAFCQELARHQVLVLCLEDLHWADVATVDLLAYLAGKCASLRLLVVLTYRPSDLLLGQHPFVRVQHDLQARGVCRELAVGLLSREDVESCLTQQFPDHDFPSDFAALLHAQTEGNPLFLAALLGDLRDRAVIVSAAGRWQLTGPALQRELPESLRGLIQRKIDRLDEADLRLLAAASVQGYEFDTTTVARALALDAAEVEERLDALCRRHLLLRCLGEHELPDRALTQRYQFRHILYQNAIYATLRPARRAAVSAAVAEALVAGHGADHPALAAPLAVLFETARDGGRAASHFHRAAQAAGLVFAHAEAAALARRGLDMLRLVPADADRARHELRLQLTLGLQLLASQGYSAAEVAASFQRARALCGQLGDTPEFFTVLFTLGLFNLIRGDLNAAAGLSSLLLELADASGDPARRPQALLLQGSVQLYQGAPGAAAQTLGQVAALCDPVQLRAHLQQVGLDVGPFARSMQAGALWLGGCPERAQAALAADGRGTTHGLSVAHVQLFTAFLHLLARDAPRTQQCVEAALRLASEPAFPYYPGAGAILPGLSEDRRGALGRRGTTALADIFRALAGIWHGWALAAQGRTEEGLATIQRGLAAHRATGAGIHRPHALGLLAEVLSQGGRHAEALAALSEALAASAATGEHYYDAELHRLRGETSLRLARDQADQDEAEASLDQAVAVARSQGARALELRAALSRARLDVNRDRRDSAVQALRAVVSEYTEGLDMPDVRAAHAFLTEIG